MQVGAKRTKIPSRHTMAWWGCGLGLLGLGGVSLAAAAEPTAIAWSSAQLRQAKVHVEAVQAPGSASAPPPWHLQGTVELSPQAVDLVSLPVGAVLQQVLVSPGETVRAGQRLARLSSPELLTLQREALQARAQARLAQSKADRDAALLAEGLIPAGRAQESRSQADQADWLAREREQALRLMGGRPQATQLDASLWLHARAPGTVLELLATPGQNLAAGAPVLRVGTLGRYTVLLQTTAEQAQRLAPNTRLAVAGCRAPAVVRAASPLVSAANQSVQVRAELVTREPCVRAQQFVTVSLTDGPAAETATRWPRVAAKAVVREQGEPYVFVKTAQGFVPTRITIADEVGSTWGVSQGLKAGDEVAVQGLAALKGAWQGLGREAP